MSGSRLKIDRAIAPDDDEGLVNFFRASLANARRPIVGHPERKASAIVFIADLSDAPSEAISVCSNLSVHGLISTLAPTFRVAIEAAGEQAPWPAELFARWTAVHDELRKLGRSAIEGARRQREERSGG